MVNSGSEPPRWHCTRSNLCRTPVAPAPWAARSCPARGPQGVRCLGACASPRPSLLSSVWPLSSQVGRGLRARSWVCGRRERTANPVRSVSAPQTRWARTQGGAGAKASSAPPGPTGEAQPAVALVPTLSPTGAVLSSAVTAHVWAACRKAHLVFALDQLGFGFNILFSLS